MLALALIFLLGVLVATLGALLLVPVIWRKAQTLAWREAEATLPMTMPEIQAEADLARAEAAMKIRMQEIIAAQAREEAAKARAETGRLAARLAQFDPTALTTTSETGRSVEATLEALRRDIPANAPDIAETAQVLKTEDDGSENRLLLATALMRIQQLEIELEQTRNRRKPIGGEASPATDIPPATNADEPTAPDTGLDTAAANLIRYGTEGGLRADIVGMAASGKDAETQAAIRRRLDEITASVAALAVAQAPADSRLKQMIDDASAADAATTGKLGGLIIETVQNSK